MESVVHSTYMKYREIGTLVCTLLSSLLCCVYIPCCVSLSSTLGVSLYVKIILMMIFNCYIERHWPMSANPTLNRDETHTSEHRRTRKNKKKTRRMKRPEQTQSKTEESSDSQTLHWLTHCRQYHWWLNDWPQSHAPIEVTRSTQYTTRTLIHDLKPKPQLTTWKDNAASANINPYIRRH